MTFVCSHLLQGLHGAHREHTSSNVKGEKYQNQKTVVDSLHLCKMHKTYLNGWKFNLKSFVFIPIHATISLSAPT